MKNLVQWLLLLLVVGCSNNATSVVVTVDAEPGVVADSARLHLIVLGGAGRTTAPSAARFDRVLAPGGADPAYPFVFTLAPLDGDVGRSYGVTATAETADGALVAQTRAIGSYMEGRTLTIHLLLEDVCRGVICSDEQTCRGGECVDARTGADTDAGTPEDAGTDLGQDMNETDLGTVDLGPDLGATDLGTTDMGPSDLGVTDLGAPDLGPPDMGPPDLGTDAGGCTAYRPYTWSIEYRPAAGSVFPCTTAPPTRTAGASATTDLFGVCAGSCTCTTTADVCSAHRTMTCSAGRVEENYVFDLSGYRFTGQRTGIPTSGVTCVLDVIGTWVSP